jgi:hypothetical protein
MLVSTLREKSFVVEDTSVIAVVNFIRFRVASMESDLIDKAVVADLYREILDSIGNILHSVETIFAILILRFFIYAFRRHR